MNKIEFAKLNKDQMKIAFNQLKDDYSKLFNQLEKKGKIIDEAIEFIKKYREYEKIGDKDYLKDRDKFGVLDYWQIQDLLEILERGKNND